LYYVHRWDPTTPIEETLRALDDLVRAGKIRYVGVSVFASWQLARASLLADVRGWTPITVLQSEYNMLQRTVEQEVLPCCLAYDIGFVPYYPLAGGFLTGKYKRGKAAPSGSRGEKNETVRQYMTASYYDKIEALESWAGERDRALNELAQAWLLAQPSVCSVISGVTKLEQFESNVDAAEWVLSDHDLAEIDAILND
jgi:aryl-alcohol dehydrogenase-like predicted oxidoreductase